MTLPSQAPGVHTRHDGPHDNPDAHATARLMVDHHDSDARLLALAACQSLPDVTGVLILADRLGELGDPRELAARRFAGWFARVADVPPRAVYGFGGGLAEITFDHMPAAVASAVAWLNLWTLSGLHGRPQCDSVRLAALAVLGLAGPRSPDAVLWFDSTECESGYSPWSNRLIADPWLAVRNSLRRAARWLLCADTSIESWRAACETVRGWVSLPSNLTVDYRRRAAWNVLGGCVELLVTTGTIGLVRSARRHWSAVEFLVRPEGGCGE